MIGEHSCYHQSIQGDEAIRRLQASGHTHCYLTRYSEAWKSYLLSVYEKRRPKDVEKHFKIVIENTKHRINGLAKDFGDIKQLLEFYEGHRIHPSLKNIGCNYTEEAYLELERAQENQQAEGNIEINRVIQDINRPPPDNINNRQPQHPEENRPQETNQSPNVAPNRQRRKCTIL